MVLEADVLLDGEDIHSSNPEDAEHWVRVYSELLVAVMGLDRQLGADGFIRIRDRAERWERRLAFWQERRQQVARASPEFAGIDSGSGRQRLKARRHGSRRGDLGYDPVEGQEVLLAPGVSGMPAGNGDHIRNTWERDVLGHVILLYKRTSVRLP